MDPVGPGKPERLEYVVPLYTGSPMGFGEGVIVWLPITISGICADGNVMFAVGLADADAGVVWKPSAMHKHKWVPSGANIQRQWSNSARQIDLRR